MECKYKLSTTVDGGDIIIPSINNTNSFFDFELSLLGYLSKLESENEKIEFEERIENDFKDSSAGKNFDTTVPLTTLNNVKSTIGEKLSVNANSILSNFKTKLNIHTPRFIIGNLPNDIKYSYNSERDIIFINSTAENKEELLILGLLEQYAYKSPMHTDKTVPAINRWLNNSNDIDVSIANTLWGSFNFVEEDKDYIRKIILESNSINTINAYERAISQEHLNTNDIYRDYYNKAVEERELWYGMSDAKVPVGDIKPGSLLSMTTPKGILPPVIYIDYRISGTDENYFIEVKVLELEENAYPKWVRLKDTYSVRSYINKQFEVTEELKKGQLLKIPLPTNPIHRKTILFNSLKAGDQVAKADGKFEFVLGLQGLNVILEEGLVKLGDITDVQFNILAHTEIKNSESVEEGALSVPYDASQNITVGNKIKLDSEIYTVIATSSTLIQVKNKAVVSKVWIVAQGDTFKVINVTKDQNIKSMQVVLQDAALENTVKSLKTDILLENVKKVYSGNEKTTTNYFQTDYNIIDYYNTFILSPGDIIYKENQDGKGGKKYGVISPFNAYYIVYDESNNSYIQISEETLKGSIIFTKKLQEESLVAKSLDINRYFVTTDKNQDFGETHQKVISRVLRKNKRIKIVPLKEPNGTPGNIFTTSLQKGYKDITEEYLKFTEADKGKQAYTIYYNNVAKRDDTGYTTIKDFKINNVNDIIPGSIVHFQNTNEWLVEKTIGDKLLISYSFYLEDTPITVKKLINPSDIKRLKVPSYATEMISRLSYTKASKPIVNYSKSDSSDMIASMVGLLEDKFGVKINLVGSDILGLLRAEIRNGELFVNVDLASIEEPLHELLHLVLASMKATDYESYRLLVSGAQKHPLFEEVSKVYIESNLDRSEETFIRLLTDTVRNKIIIEGIFTEEIFDKSVKEAISNLLELRDSITDEFLYDILDSKVVDVLENFNSNFLNNREPLFKADKALEMLRMSTIIRTLLENGELKEYCNG